ncbi:uncharacterized protein CMU_023640 [Cryptosporidium muris RN66]|uniref:Uncharacterized protein n=1 Tax=Cryptosporidium muris (strain RN66) TaxID=441375 RepID=B6AC06_CRYMR|nr:uncharacterized protein CMU_023640 [Cryptosporidium muris RN66]EEA05359.1 hypothetical protein CMU_023640 [Cryptosporidium muris RN66]|eukprot:XP_002139708.1 hypothetical protein [Cryptosporidium muris RN66]
MKTKTLVFELIFGALMSTYILTKSSEIFYLIEPTDISDKKEQNKEFSELFPTDFDRIPRAEMMYSEDAAKPSSDFLPVLFTSSLAKNDILDIGGSNRELIPDSFENIFIFMEENMNLPVFPSKEYKPIINTIINSTEKTKDLEFGVKSDMRISQNSSKPLLLFSREPSSTYPENAYLPTSMDEVNLEDKHTPLITNSYNKFKYIPYGNKKEKLRRGRRLGLQIPTGKPGPSPFEPQSAKEIITESNMDTTSLNLKNATIINSGFDIVSITNDFLNEEVGVSSKSHIRTSLTFIKEQTNSSATNS